MISTKKDITNGASALGHGFKKSITQVAGTDWTKPTMNAHLGWLLELIIL